MGNFVGLFYDVNGNLAKLVIDDNDNYAAHSEQRYLFVQLDKTTYNSLPVALNMGGIAVPNDLNKSVVSQVLQLDPNIGAKLQANIVATDSVINQVVV